MRPSSPIAASSYDAGARRRHRPAPARRAASGPGGRPHRTRRRSPRLTCPQRSADNVVIWRTRPDRSPREPGGRAASSSARRRWRRAALTGGAAVGRRGPHRSAAPSPLARRASSSTAAADAPPWRSAGPYPASFDLRAAGKVSPVRQQENYSTCWIQSAMSSLESSLLPDAALRLLREQPRQPHGVQARLRGPRRQPPRGGLLHALGRPRARALGPVSPQRQVARGPAGPCGTSGRALPARTARGPWTTTPSSGPCPPWAASPCAMAFDNTVHRHRAPGPTARRQPGLFLNHYVTVVGWDDHFPAAAFPDAPRRATAPSSSRTAGAPTGATRGYFWLSYYDANFGHDMAVFGGAEAPTDYDAIYQHDPLGWSGSMHVGGGRGETAWFAARYRRRRHRSVAAAGFYAPVPAARSRCVWPPRWTASPPRLRRRRGTAPVGRLPHGRPHGAGGRAGRRGLRRRRQAHRAGLRPSPSPLERRPALIAPSSAPGQSYVSADGVGSGPTSRRCRVRAAATCASRRSSTRTAPGDVQAAVASR